MPAPEPLLYQGGSNGKNIAHVWVEPQRDAAMVLMTNIGGTRAEEGLRALAAELYRNFLAAHAPGSAAIAPEVTPKTGAGEPLIFNPPGPPRHPSFSGDTRRGVGK